LVDWDGDGATDVLVNSENALWIRNVGTDDGKTILRPIGNLATRNVAGHTSSPSVADFDRDGKPDLIVGSENGRIYHIRHDDCIAYPQTDSADANGDKSPPVAPERIGPPPVDHSTQSVMTQTSRGPISVWVGEGRLRFSFHDGLSWSKPQVIASVTKPDWISSLKLDFAGGDQRIRLRFLITAEDGSTRSEERVSFDRGRTYRSDDGTE
jgi:hypothetical protein